MSNFTWSMHTSKELKKKIDLGQKSAILPFGSTEQHGDHLATGYDSLIASRLSQDLARELNAFVLPEFYIGEASHHFGFCGTLSFSNETLQRMLNDLCDSLIRNGIERLIIVNGHGGNYKVIKSFAESFNKENFKIIHDGDSEILFTVISKLSLKYSNADLGLHAGMFETSLALFTHPESVRISEIKIGAMPSDGAQWSKSEAAKLISKGILKSSPSGIIGDPRASNAENGDYFYNLILKEYLQLIASQT